MNGISHKQARRYMLADQDGLLNDSRRLDLETHLAGCEACRAESESLSTLTSRLQSEFHERWDAHDGPSQNVTANVRLRTRRIIMSNRVNWGLRALGGIAVLVVLGFVVNFVVSQLQKRSVAASPTTVPANLMPVVSPNAEKRLLAFTMERNGETDVYTVRADGTNLTNLTGDSNGNNPYWSPDGKRIAFNRTIGSQSQIFIMDADGSNVIQLTDDGDFNKLVAFEEGRDPDFNAWSPDGSKLIFVKLNFERANDEGWMKIYVLDVATKTQTPLTEEWGLYQSPAWSPDGKHIAFTSFSRFDEQGEPTRLSVHVVGADGSNPVDLTASLGEDVFSIFHRWSSDAQAVLFSTYRQSDESFQVYKAQLDGSLTELSQPTLGLLDWWDGTALRVDREDVTVNWLRPDGTSSSLKVCPSVNDTNKVSSTRSKAGILFLGVRCTRGEWRLYLANEDGRVVQELLDPPLSTSDGSMIDQAWSPDDNFIAFNISSSSGDVEMFILNVAETLNDPTLEPVWFNVGQIFSSTDSISWQPVITEETLAERPPQSYEGLVAFTSAMENENLDIYTMHPDRSGLTNLTKNPAHDVDPYWSPDGKRIAFLSDRAGYMQIFVMNADGSDVFQLTHREADHEFASIDPWSPDGSTLVFIEKTPDGKQVLYTMEANGRNGIPLVNQPNIYSAVSWSPDSSHIAYIVLEPVGDRDMARIHVVDSNGDDTTNVTNLLPADEDIVSWNYSWSQRGRSITFVAGQYAWENNDGRYVVYEASLDGNTLAEIVVYPTRMEDWWDGTAFIQGFDGTTSTLTWLRADWTTSTLKPYENCQTKGNFAGMYKRSSNGSLTYGAQCTNGDLWLYWANSDGTTIKQLLNYPIPAKDGSLVDVSRLPDDSFIAFNIAFPTKTEMYIMDLTEAFDNPSIQPEKMVVGGAGFITYNISWQPMP